MISNCGSALVIDDNSMVRKITCAHLRQFGYTVHEAENGLEGIKVYEKNKDVSLVLLDLEMPVMNGEETLEELLKINPRLDVIIITGCIDEERVASLMQSKNISLLRKPFQTCELKEAINLSPQF